MRAYQLHDLLYWQDGGKWWDISGLPEPLGLMGNFHKQSFFFLLLCSRAFGLLKRYFRMLASNSFASFTTNGVNIYCIFSYQFIFYFFIYASQICLTLVKIKSNITPSKRILLTITVPVLQINRFNPLNIETFEKRNYVYTGHV